MSVMRKRTRKCKLEPRKDVDCTESLDKTDNTKLQQLPLLMQSRRDSLNLDHTYSLQISTPSLQSPMKLSVKVEVEEFDESIMDTDPINTNDSLQTFVPGPSNSIEMNKKVSKRHSSLQVFHVDIEKMYKISDHISWSSSNPADKYFNIEIRNSWGHIFKLEEDNEPYNALIQKALNAWGLALINGRQWRESPLFYQCHICNLAWWHLQPFKEHIKQMHDHRYLKVYHQANMQESIIVASNCCSSVVRYIPCEGNCYRCGVDYESHIKRQNKSYTCIKCNGTFELCFQYMKHLLTCIHKKPYKTPPKFMTCNICFFPYLNEEDMYTHKARTHVVRSDEPSQISYKTCTVCNKKYHHYNMHMCPRSPMNGTCTHCYRKFPTKTLAVLHIAMSIKNYKCTICGLVLPRKCMETEHMLTHTDKYRMAYKCSFSECPPTTLYANESSVLSHRVIYHKVKVDRRRTFCEMVIIPDKYPRLNYIRGEDVAAACQELQSQEDDLDAESSQINQKEGQESFEILPEDIYIKKEMEEVEDYSIGDESQDEEPDEYEQMLSKVFKVTDGRKYHRVKDAVETQLIKIKTEPLDREDVANRIESQENSMKDILKKKNIMQENLIQGNPIQENTIQENMIQENTIQENTIQENLIQQKVIQNIQFHENLVTIKQEPIEIDGTCSIDDEFELCDIKAEPIEISITNTEDCAVSAVGDEVINVFKMESEEVRQDFFGETDINCVEKVTEETPAETPANTEVDKTIGKQKLRKTLKTFTKAYPGDKVKYIIQQKLLKGEMVPLKKAIKGVRQRRRYRCNLCGYTNVHKWFRIHKESNCQKSPQPIENESYLCTKCDQSFYNLKLYLLHFESHGYESFTCPGCNAKFDNIKDLLQHFHRHIKQCFVNFWMINKKSNVSTKKQHRCQQCLKIVNSSDYFSHWESHLVLMKNGPMKPEPVPEPESVGKLINTNKKLLHDSVLQILLKQLLGVSYERKCLICERQFNRNSDFKRHLIEHLLSDAYVKRLVAPNKSLRCQICSQEFGLMVKYKVHMREHGNLPVYKCQLCDKYFSDSSNFAKHKKIHSLQVLICDICKKKFQAKSQLVKHILMHQVTKPIKCKPCGTKYYTKSQYNKHRKSRHGDRPFKPRCIPCDVSFNSLREKWDHAWKEHKERKHKIDCPVCHQGFRKFHDLKTHAKGTHQMDITAFTKKRRKAWIKNRTKLNDYEQMWLDAFETASGQPVNVAAEPQAITIKAEPLDRDEFENLLDIDENSVTIKEEPIEVDATCYIDEDMQLRHIKAEPMEISATDVEDYAVSCSGEEPILTPEEVKRELIEATDMMIIDNVTTEPPPMTFANMDINKIKIAKKKLVNVLTEAYSGDGQKCIVQQKFVGNVEWVPRKKKIKRERKRKLYRCAKCGYTNEHKLYRIHKESQCKTSPGSIGNDSFLCTKCDTTFCNLKLYLVHFDSHGYESLKCPGCNKNFDSMEDLKSHFLLHVKRCFVGLWVSDNESNDSTKMQKECKKCYEFVDSKDFFAHWESHLLLNNGAVEATVTQPVTAEHISTPNKKMLQEPMLSAVLKQLRSVAHEKLCLICVRQFIRRLDFKRHLIEHLLADAYAKRPITPTKMLRCQICQRDLPSMIQYKGHMREHGNVRFFSCQICNRDFSDSSNLAKHKKTHSVELLICDICQKKFHVKRQLEKHMLMHQVTEPVQCTQCGLKFFTQSQYKKHEKHKHKNHNAKFTCVTCGTCFDSLREKWDHAWIEHKERKHKADCPVCHQGFRKFMDLKHHAKLFHNMEMPSFRVRSKNKRAVKRKSKSKKKKQETLLVPLGVLKES